MLFCNMSMVVPFLAICIGVLSIIWGICTLVSVWFLCWLAGVFEILVGLLTVVFELSPYLTSVLRFVFVNRLAEFNAAKPLWYRGIVYAVFAVIFILCNLMCWSWATVVNIILYILLAGVVVAMHFMASRNEASGLGTPGTGTSTTPIGGQPKF